MDGMGSSAAGRTTWDGQPVSPDPPYGCMVVVYRLGRQDIEVLVLHRANHPDAGDWAWTPPSGCRLPGEPLPTCARRELREETGLSLTLSPTSCGTAEWPVFVAEAPPESKVVLDAEHDDYAWLTPEVAVARCGPAVVSDALARTVAWLRAGR